MKYAMEYMQYFLPPANEVCKGYVFTGVCLSRGECEAGEHAWWWLGGVHGRGGVWQWGMACVAGGHAWMAGGVCGGGVDVWQGACMTGGVYGRGGHAWHTCPPQAGTARYDQ